MAEGEGEGGGGPTAADIAEEMEKRKKAAEATVESIEDQIKAQEQALENYELIGESQQRNSLIAAQEKSIAQERLKLANKALEIELQKKEVDEVKLKKAYEAKMVAEDAIDLLEENLKLANQTTAAFEEGVRAAGDLGAALGKAFGQYGSHPLLNVANLGKVWKSFRGGSNSVKAFATNLIKAGVGAFINSMINLVFIMNESESAFRKATGGGKSLAREMTNGYERTRKYTVSVKENQEAWTSLHGTFTDFTMTSESTRAQLGDTVAIMSQLGVSADVSSKAMQSLTISFGDTAETASRSLLELRAAAVDLGVAPAMLIEQFGSMGNRLAKMGSQGVDAFKDLARISKITGMELGKLIALTEKFDTFEGAAERAGMLNAALGGNFVNAMDLMMETDPAARFEMIRDAIKDTGLTFDDMSYYQRKFYTEAAGLEEVSDLAALMRGDMDALSGGLNQTSADYAAAAEEARNMATFQERLQALFMRLIPVLKPVIDGIERFITHLERVMDGSEKLSPTLTNLMSILKGVGTAIKFVVNHWKALAIVWGLFKFKALIGSLAGITAGLFSTATAEAAAGTAGAGATVGVTGFAAGVLAIGAGIGIAAGGLGILISSFKDLKDVGLKEFGKGIGIIAVSIAALAGAMALMGNPLSMAGLGVLVGLGAAGAAIGALMGVFKRDKNELEGLGEVFSAYSEVQGAQLETGMAAFESMKDSINEMSGKKLGALAILAPAMAISAMVSPRSTPTPAAGGQSGTQRIRNEITITLEGRQLQSFVEETVGAVVGNAALGNG